MVRVCLYCGEFTHKPVDACPWCGSEGLEAVEEEDEWL
jgi:uncharacterized OB-fold protein